MIKTTTLIKMVNEIKNTDKYLIALTIGASLGFIAGMFLMIISLTVPVGM